MSPAKGPTSLYVHIPFCRSKCRYCGFVSFGGRLGDVDRYLTALEREAQMYSGREVATIFVGGGTPSILDAGQLERFFAMLRKHFVWQLSAEVTLEMNPATFDIAKARLLRELGVDRVSLGLQSFDDKSLAWLGRPHTAREGRQAFEVLRQAGFTNINVDIIYSLPGQGPGDILSNIEEAMALDPEHISAYMLGIDSGSCFYRDKVQGNDADTQARDFQAVWDRLERSPWHPYEISNAAKSGFACRHNRVYWSAGDYIGLGVSAHSHEEGHRLWNTSDLADYLRASSEDPRRMRAGEEHLIPRRRLLEALLIGLRLTEGVDIQALEERFGAVLGPDRRRRIDRFVRDGFLAAEGSFLRVAARGRLVLDEVSASLM